MSNPENWRHKLRVLERLGIESGNRILDYGCGAGAAVHSMAEAGLDAYGFDVLDYVEQPSNRIAIGSPARLPYPDNHFDAVFSDQVFEHAMDQERVFAELHRVTRPGGVHLHVIPAKWQIIEPHIYVPLGGLIGARWWYRLWATLGIRNEFQRGLNATDTAERNWRFFHEGLNYIGTGAYRRIWRRAGFEVLLVERDYMAVSDKPQVRYLARVALLPGVLAVIRTFWVRIVVLQRPVMPLPYK